MTTADLVDRSQRDRAVSEFSLPVCVEAAAGTGKTRLMVDRVVEIIRRGHAAIHEVVAITFTEAAAAELRAKIRRALEDQAHDEIQDDEQRARFQEAVANLDGAHIETIHAFAQSILKERPIEAGITPRFEVLDELAMKLDVEEAWDEWFAVALEEDASAVERALLLDFDFKWIKKIGMILNDNRDLLNLKNPVAVFPNVDGYIRSLVVKAGELDALREHCRSSTDNGRRQIDQISRYSAQLAPAKGEEALRIIASGVKIDPSRGNQNNWDPPDRCREQKVICRELAASQETIRSELRSYALGRLITSLEEFPPWYEARRRREGRLDFDDLLVFTQRLLREHSHVRRHFKQKFRFLLVDEFQDTDPLQVEIVFFLSEQIAETASEWTSVNLEPGKLFVVGDPKQSIYRFRRADIAIYDEAKRIIEQTNKAIPIQQNFRCSSEIVEFVNRVFAKEMQPELGIQADYIDLVGLEKRATPLAGARVAAMTPRDDYQSDTDRGRFMEARQVASLVEQIVGNWEIETDDEPPVVRKATYSDIAILIPGRTGLEIYEEVFREAGLAYTHEGGWFFYQRQETRDLIAFLSALDNPGDNLAIVATLRNIYGVPDEELLKFKNAGNDFDYLSKFQGFANIADAFATLEAIHGTRNDVSLSALVDRCIADTRLIEAALTRKGGHQAVANLRKFTQTARQFQLQGGATLHRFVGWLRQNRDLTAREGDSPFSEAPGEEVKLLTAHGAKGLEFNVVILANLGLALHRGNQEYIDRQHRTIHFKRTKPGNRKRLPTVFKSPGFDDAEATESRRQHAEWIRVLYVAATRARDHLVISSFPNAWNEESWLGLFADGLDDLPVIHGEDLPIPSTTAPGQDLPGTADPAEMLAGRQEWLAQRAHLLESLPTAIVISPSATETKTLGAHVTTTSEDPIPVSLVSEASRLGSAFHRVLEVVDLAAYDPAGLHSICNSVATEYGLTDRAMELLDLATNVLSSRLLTRALKADMVYRELPFSLPVQGVLVQGAIDLLFSENGHLVVGDFKSDNVTSAQAGDRAVKYRAQAALYTLACERLTARKVREFVFVFARPAVEITLPGTGLADEGLAILRAAKEAVSDTDL